MGAEEDGHEWEEGGGIGWEETEVVLRNRRREVKSIKIDFIRILGKVRGGNGEEGGVSRWE